MKLQKAMCAAVLLVVTSQCRGDEFKARPCCREGLMRRRVCADGNNISLGCEHMFRLEEYIITEDGLTTKDTPGYVWSTNASEFCVGRLEQNGTGTTKPSVVDVAVVCYDKLDVTFGDNPIHFKIYGVLVIISVFFLILTLWVYFLLPQLRDLQGKCIMCQSGCLALGFLNLGIIQLAVNDGSNFLTAYCAVNSFMMYFWFIAMFFWSNVVSVNIFRSISHYKHLKRTESRQFTYYSVYAWGSSLAFLAVALIVENIEGSHLKPNFGGVNNTCWFSDDLETWVFFYGPVAVLIVINIAMFILSSRLLWTDSYRHESNILDALKYKFSLYLKIFIVTGVTWIFEVAGFAHSDKTLIIWRIADIFNCIQGIAFFLLLVVFRRRALRGLEDLGFNCFGLIPVLLRCFPQDKETELIVESEENYNEHVEAPFEVNLN